MPRAKAKAKEIPINEIIVKEEKIPDHTPPPTPSTTPPPPPVLERQPKKTEPTKLQAENGYITDTTGEV